jgi:pyruvate,orthophosphate dikinase
MAKKLVYDFSAKKTDGNAEMKDLLGGKGANLAEMTSMGIPVPPGFTISTRACNLFFEMGHKLPDGLAGEVRSGMKKLEKARGKKFGDNKDPLLVSVRSGAKFSMPGMMDTILNLGLNDVAVEGLASSSGNRRFAFDSYRRFIQMYGDVVLEIPKSRFENLLEALKKSRKVRNDTDLNAADLENLTGKYKTLVKKVSGKSFPQDPEKQLWGSVMAVFRSWDNERARIYRQKYGIADNLGTAVNIQCMVYGNLGEGCATGVAFTRNPATGENLLYGEYLMNAQGEDVVAGIRTPSPISSQQAVGDDTESLEKAMPDCYRQLLDIRKRLEKRYRDMQDIEFTIEKDQLYMLQTRTGKRTGMAAIRIAFDFYGERKIGRNEVVERVEPDMLTQLLAPIFNQKDKDKAAGEGRRYGRGLPAGPGAAAGLVVFSAEEAKKVSSAGNDVILVRRETSPEDLAGMVAAEGILTSRGGMTSHAAVVARGMGKPCIVGAEEIQINERAGTMTAGGRVVKKGTLISIDGGTGEVFIGDLHPHPSEIQQVLVEKSLKPENSETFRLFKKLMKWADKIRSLTVRTNADTPRDAMIARAFGAQGIGLCRTEHMFFGEKRIRAVREMILAEDIKARKKPLSKLLPMQRRDFEAIFKALDGLPVNIRLLDPPLHEFLPTSHAHFKELAADMGLPIGKLKQKAEQLEEVNPMLGHRGCRLGITYPEIYEMQARAIMEAAVRAKKDGCRVFPEIMIPLIGTVQEYKDLRDKVRDVAEDVLRKAGVKIKYQIGTMMEIPRACLTAREVGAEAEFFSFGTNDLTQMTFGFSRDDIGKFLPEYLERRILPVDPFESIDTTGVGRLVEMGVKDGRVANENLKIGVCGEHGGDPASVAFFHRAGLNYVSCSPYRVPVARLAAAQAVLAEKGSSGSGTA